MDKSSQNNLYAGLLIYRSQRNVEYLLLNDSFTNKKHWFCPKGQVIGQEDEVKCALRETFEVTGLSPKDLRVEEGFKIELKYLSGTRPKKVVYRLAQILDNHARLLPNADGVHFQWCNQHVATEKVIFKSMEDVFKYAQQFIENKLKTRQQNRRNRDNNGDSMDHRQRHHHNNHRQQHGSSTTTRNMPSSSPQVNGLVTHHQNNHHLRQQQNSSSNQQHDQQQRRQNQQNENSAAANPLYKTRLCERFEKEGMCSYGSKCTFAHGIVELRERIAEEENRNGSNNDQINGNHNNSNSNNNGIMAAALPMPSVTAANNSSNTTTNNKSTSSNAEANLLFKTKLCERFMKDNFCQYGPKCHFAHGTQELKERPVFNNNNENGNGRRSEDEQYSSSQQPYQEKQHYQEVHHHQMQSQTQQPQRVASPPVEHHHYQQQPQQQQRYFRQQQQPQQQPHHHQQQQQHLHGEERSAAGGSWRARTHINNSTTTNSNFSNSNTHNNNNDYQNMDENSINNPEHPDLSKRDIVEDIPKPIAVKQNGRSNSMNNNTATTTSTTASSNTKNNSSINKSMEKQNQRNSNTPLREVMNGRISPTNKSWMKVVHLSKEEQAQLEMSPPAKTPSPTPAKAAQEEAIIGDLKKYFAEHTASQATSNGKLSDDVKEVTKLEMRNDLSKRQLLFILLASLLEDSPSGVGATLKARITLFQTFVKNMTDQRTLLKAWEKFVTQRSPGLLSKTIVAFSTWYDCDLVDEEAFFGWYAVLQDGSELKVKSSKFIEWLSTADEDDE
ncbi:hypothetical protein INT45_010210 [Circinella minor]|uniref:Uncharacterized protein n=1 Tax=Circinella minor TaxID=1195481 RepID=A0A8H7SD33_9FUNG|nr:hypothetical protein INT45_010210 [Circinella minor]